VRAGEEHLPRSRAGDISPGDGGASMRMYWAMSLILASLTSGSGAGSEAAVAGAAGFTFSVGDTGT
jgi:hypothetical protein